MKMIKFSKTMHGSEELTLPSEEPKPVETPVAPKLEKPAKPPKTPSPPVEDEPTPPPRKTRGDALEYFLNIGFVAYDNGYILTHRQIIKFGDVCKKWVRPDLAFSRQTVLMRAEDGEQQGMPYGYDVKARHPGFAELPNDSYMAYLRPDGYVGFSGKLYSENEKPLLTKDTVDLLSRVRPSTWMIEGNPENSGRSLWPTFFVRVKTNTMVPGADLMFDLDAKQWVWVLELPSHLAPIVAGCPGGVSAVELDAWDAKIFEAFQFLGPIYIGMPNVRAPGSPRLGAMERPEWATQPVHKTQVYQTMVDHELQFDAWAFPCPPAGCDIRTYEARVLNAWARQQINQNPGTTM